MATYGIDSAKLGGLHRAQTALRDTSGRFVSNILCYVCNKPITAQEWDNRHDWHEPDCPNYFLDSPFIDECNCTREVHEGCCPVCHPKGG